MVLIEMFFPVQLWSILVNAWELSRVKRRRRVVLWPNFARWISTCRPESGYPFIRIPLIWWCASHLRPPSSSIPRIKHPISCTWRYLRWSKRITAPFRPSWVRRLPTPWGIHDQKKTFSSVIHSSCIICQIQLAVVLPSTKIRLPTLHPFKKVIGI